jgi:succinylglutamate desuccinylase
MGYLTCQQKKHLKTDFLTLRFLVILLVIGNPRIMRKGNRAIHVDVNLRLWFVLF